MSRVIQFEARPLLIGGSLNGEESLMVININWQNIRNAHPLASAPLPYYMKFSRHVNFAIFKVRLFRET